MPLVAAALLVLAWVFTQRRFSTRLMLGIVIALSVLALLVELGFWEAGRSLIMGLASMPYDHPIGVQWGCWAAVVINLIALAESAFLLWRVRGRG